MKNDPLTERIEKLLEIYSLDDFFDLVECTPSEAITYLVATGFIQLPDIEEPL